MLKIVKESHNSNRAEFVVEATDIETIMSAEASALAIEKAASFGLNRPGVSTATGPYPVDETGEPTDDVIAGRKQPSAYRRDLVVMGTF